MNTRVKASLKMTLLSPEDKVTEGQSIINSITASPVYFPPATFPMPMASVTASVTNLNSAILAATNGTPGSVSNMHEKERIVISVFNVLRAYVEMMANNTADPKTVIESAGMKVSKDGGGNTVTELTVIALGNGIIQILVPRLEGEAAFVYYYSSDGGLTWQEFESSKLSKVQLKNQIPGSTLLFKYVAIGKTKGSLSQPKSVMVI